MPPLDHVLFLLCRVGSSIHQLNQAAEREIGLSLVQWSLLRHLIDMPCTSAQELAHAVKVHPSTLTQSLRRLQRKDLIFVGGDPKDSRRKLIVITRRGRDVLRAAAPKIQRQMGRLLRVSQSLRGLADGLGQVGEPRSYPKPRSPNAEGRWPASTPTH